MNFLSIYALLPFTVVASSVTSILRAVYAKKYSMSGKNLWRFNFIQNLFCFIVILFVNLISKTDFTFSKFSLLLGVLLGIANILSLEFLLRAQKIGTVSYTAVIVSLSAILPTLSGLLFFDEKISFTQFIGLLFMIICIVLSTDNSGKEKTSALWLLFCAITFVATGFIGVIQKFHQNSSAHKKEMTVLLLTCFFISMTFSLMKFLTSKASRHDKIDKQIYILPILTSICFSFQHMINLFLSGVLPSIILFPIANFSPMLIVMFFQSFS